MYLDRYLFCSNEPGWLGSVFLLLIANWIVGAVIIGLIRSRGQVAWPWSVAWFFGSLVIFAVALYSASEPTDCGFGGY